MNDIHDKFARKMFQADAGPGLEPREIGMNPLLSAPYDMRARDERRPTFPFGLLNDEDLKTALTILGWKKAEEGLLDGTFHAALQRLNFPDATIFDATGAVPYLYRWHVIPRNSFAGVYLHVQVADDPDERGPHDHDYDSQSAILAGAYLDHTFYVYQSAAGPALRECEPWGTLYKKGDIVRRQADTPHRLTIAEDAPYTMSLFSTGPRYRKWGFYNPDGSFSLAEANADIVNGIAAGRRRT